MREMPRGCGVVILLDVARLRRCERGCRPDRHRHGFTRVSRAAKAGDKSFTRVSRLASPPPPIFLRMRARAAAE